MSTVANNAEFDIIFAGGGTAACVTAGRLAAASPSLRILLLEAGPHTLNDPLHIQPGRFFSHVVPGGKTMKFVLADPAKTAGRQMVVTTAGECVGGGSSVNFSMYTRAAASEFDAWDEQFSNLGWGSKDLLPLLRKCETYEPNPSGPTHGSSGPLHVSLGGFYSNIGKDFLDVAKAYDKERRFLEDGNDFVNVNGYARWPKFINGTTGRRSDVAHDYIYTQQHNKNLTVLAGYHVQRVLFQNGRATGVEYTPNSRIHPDAPQALLTAYASKLVVVSAGSWGSPAILERSGIGATSVLEKFGIKKVVDLPGVGERYQDHQCLIATYLASEESETMDGIAKGDPVETEKWNAQWLKDGTGMLASNAMDSGIKYRPSPSELAAIGPAFQAKWDAQYANAPDKAVMWFGSASVCFSPLPTVPGGKYFGVGYFLNHPSFFGSTHITSADDPVAPHDWYPGDLDDEADTQFHIFAYKRTREFARRMACFRGEHPDQIPAFPEGSSAIVMDTLPVPAETPDLTYTAEDDKAIREFVRKFATIAMHALGTCAMMPRSQNGVVDSRLNVYGVEGLKVTDLSIAPLNIGANPYSTAVVIGEKAALIIAEELGISGV